MARTFLACGHHIEREPGAAATILCPWGCGRQVIDPEPLSTGPVQIMDDVEPHFNISLACEVRGRRHLKALQKEHGCRDWEPVVKDSYVTEWRAKFKKQGRRVT